jgi:transposase
MGHALSIHLRVRLLAATEDGLSCRAAAVRFGLGYARHKGYNAGSAGQAPELVLLSPRPA